MNGPEEQLVEGYRGICLSLSKTRAHKRKEQKEEEEEAGEEGGEGRGGKGEGKYLAFCWENSHEHGSPAPTCQSISLGLTGLETQDEVINVVTSSMKVQKAFASVILHQTVTGQGQ